MRRPCGQFLLPGIQDLLRQKKKHHIITSDPYVPGLGFKKLIISLNKERRHTFLLVFPLCLLNRGNAGLLIQQK
jgi:hypothetical protein